MITHTMPPGEYRIGDPCYSIDEWSDFCEKFHEAGEKGGYFHIFGAPVVCFYTRYGDGCYDMDGYDIPVDAGCIGAVPEHICSRDDGGWVPVTFTEEWDMTYHDGIFNFGGRIINTRDEDEFI